MSAIGISPCPPFQHNNLIPGVLYDGNTVAWYKHNDPVAGVIKDGGNRVNIWLDKFNYGLGAELVDQGAWFTVAYWTGITPNWSQVGNTLVCDGLANNNMFRNGIFAVGKTYKVTMSVIWTNGTLLVNDAVTNINKVDSTGNFVFYIKSDSATFYLQNILFNATITALSVKEITGKHLLQLAAASQPLWSPANGVLFDGVNDFMKATAFAFVQPEFIYFVGKQITWTNTDYFFDGEIVNTGIIQQTFGSPNIWAWAGGGAGITNPNLAIDTFSIIRLLLNGGASSLNVNKSGAIAANCGATNMDGFHIGAQAGGFANSNIEIKEIILRKSADNVNTQDAIYNYLKTANNV